MKTLILGMILLAGCAFASDDRGYRVSLMCVNVSAPGFSWTCPENIQVPPLPDSQKPPVQP